MTNIADALEHLIERDDFSVVERLELPARPARTVAIPDAFRDGTPGRWLTNDGQLQGRLWLHQAKALEAAADGRNVVISTGTASGKSLVFQAFAFSVLDKVDDAAVIVFYPQRSLAEDQLKSWRVAAERAGMPPDVIVKIDGSVPRGKRADLLKNGRIVLMTPDVCHAWLLDEISTSDHRDFLARISLVVIDEAHVLEGIFGSNFAYLFRRLCVTRAMARPRRQLRPLQAMAASATILTPEDHLGDLTGLKFDAIGENDDGSPQYTRSVFHVCTQHGTETETTAPLLTQLIDESDGGSFIAFVDSRPGTEQLAIKIDRDSVESYRSGFEADDRAAIENSLRAGALRGVVSTSALELGIDIPHFVVGLNVGVPRSRKSFRQRLGRVGRNSAGQFIVFAEPYAFKRFGATLEEYYRKSVEPSYLYLDNRFVQYAHARCLAEELEMLGATGRRVAPANVSWPSGFSNILDFSYPGSPSARPREFDQVALVGGNRPHLNYPLRNAPEETFSVVHRSGGPAGSPGHRVGHLNLQQAIREAFPGATYLHQKRGWRVHGWRNTAFERTIRVSPAKALWFRKPIIRTFVNLSLDREGVVDGRLRIGEGGFLAECDLQITQRVEGYRDRGERKFYKDLRQENPEMAPKTREFRTTGVAMRIDEAWFQKAGLKQRICATLRDLLRREYSISSQDVDGAATNISLIRDGRRESVSDVIVLFDATHGSLRLTEPAYLRFEHLIDQLDRSVQNTPPDDGLLSTGVVSDLRDWFDRLGDEGGSGFETSVGEAPAGWIQVFEKGSVVARRDKEGVLRDIEIVGWEIMDIDGAQKLMYLYKTHASGKAAVSAENVVSQGDRWNVVFWNSQTGETRESLDESED